MTQERKDPQTGIKPIADWGKECARGWIRDSRFGTGQVIKGTNRKASRKNRAAIERMNS